ncbi:MAG: NAD(P)H-hydrate dehydratase [Chloroflexi bacterium]|nr:NAD(P)H-hydrate dehydratase [Chloroflexota bacterium]
MSKLVTAEQMRALEAAAVAAGTSEAQLMHEAGLAAAQEAWMTIGAVETRPVLLLAGPGNNGGDALVAARQLGEWGGAVHVYLLRPRPADDPQWRAVVEAGLPATTAEQDPDFTRLESLLEQASLVLDGLLGTGQRPRERPIDGDLAEILKRLARAREASYRPQLMALDLPTGVDADTGFADPLTVAADLTVTFGFPKVGLYTAPGHTFAGRVVPVEIGLPRDAGADLPYEELRLRDVRALMPNRPNHAHKGTFGTVVIAAGSQRYPGAARLAAEAAARSGAGLVMLAAAEAIQPLLVAGLPDAVHEPLPSENGALNAAAANALLRALAGSRARALVVGPGLGSAEPTRAFVQALIAGLDATEGDLAGVVIDADGLNLLAGEPGWWERLAVPRVLTPHPGEMARLTGRAVAEVQADRLATATAFARERGSVVVLKGACTIVAAPDGRARISGAANAMLAHAGTGDVLAGLVGGLIAQGMAPYEAASAGVWLHAEAGRLVAEAYGTAAGIAQDLLRALPDARKLLEEGASSGAGGIPFGGMPFGGMPGGAAQGGGQPFGGPPFGQP